MADTPAEPAEAGLTTVLDDHIRWFSQWTRSAMFRVGHGQEPERMAPMPRSFARWVATAAAGELAGQPAVDRLATLHEQMHRLARLVLLKSRDGEPPSEADFRAVAGKYEEFVNQLRRIERAFATAASGLDPLTGLRNRASMLNDLAREHDRFVRTGAPFCIAIADIDRFKTINDRHGHDVGDKVLAAAAACIGRGIRSFDEAYRMGGEEFLICLKDVDAAEGHVVVERLRTMLEHSAIPLDARRSLSVTASFGLVQATSGISVDRLIIEADRALYKAKTSGRNRVVRVLPSHDGSAAVA